MQLKSNMFVPSNELPLSVAELGLCAMSCANFCLQSTVLVFRLGYMSNEMSQRFKKMPRPDKWRKISPGFNNVDVFAQRTESKDHLV